MQCAVLHNWATSWQNQQCGCASSEDSDQSGHLPSLIRVLAVRMKKAWVLSYPLSTNAQADLSLRWVHSHFVGFVTSQLNCCVFIILCYHKYQKKLHTRKIAVIILKYEQCGSTIEQCVQKMHMEWHSVQTLIGLLRSSLIWVYTVCANLSVPQIRIITVYIPTMS